MIVNPASYSFTPPGVAPDHYLVELRINPAQNVVRASVTIAGTATGGDFVALRQQILDRGFAGGEEELLAVTAVVGSAQSAITVDTTDVLTFQPSPDPVTNLTVTA